MIKHNICLICHFVNLNVLPSSPRNMRTVVPTKSDSDIILCLQLLSKTLMCALHLSIRESIDYLCINPILWIGLIHN